MNIFPLLILLSIFLLPPVIFIVGFMSVMKFKRQTKALIRISEKEYKFITPKIYGKKIYAKLLGKKCMWIIETKPDSINTLFGLIPFYYCEVGRSTTSTIEKSKQTELTETELSNIENQSILSALLKMDMLGKEGIIMLVGAVGVGAVIGIIIAKFAFGGGL